LVKIYSNMFKLYFFKKLALLNKYILPSLSKKRVDVFKLKKWQKFLIGYRCWVTKNSLK